MELPAWILAGIRTAVQAAVGFVIAWLAEKGIVIDAAVVEGFFFAIVTGAAAAGLRWAEAKLPWLSRIISLGLSPKQPEYVEPELAS